MRTPLTLVAAALTLLPLVAPDLHAQNIRNATSLSLAGSGIVGGDFMNLSNTIGLNRYIGEHLEVGGALSASLSRSSFGESSDTEVSGFLFGNVRYNFVSQSMLIPFVEGGVGTQLDENQDNALVRAGAGLRKFVSDNVSFDASGYMLFQNTDDGFERLGGVFLQYGFSVFFGG